MLSLRGWRRWHRIVVWGVCCLFFSGCSIRQILLVGHISRVTGNQMPSPDLPPLSYAGYPTNVYFFKPISPQDARRMSVPGFFDRIGQPLVARVATDERGLFRLRLPPGRYSVLIGKDSLFYTNIIDGDGFLNPIVVASGRRMRLELKADWGANY